MAIFPGLLYYVLGKKEIRQVESSPVKGLFLYGSCGPVFVFRRFIT